MEKWILRVEGLTGRTIVPQNPRDTEDSYIQEWLPEPVPYGTAILTKKVEEARKFDNQIEALEYWRQQHGIRPDGKPNRPLTVFTVSLEKVEV